MWSREWPVEPGAYWFYGWEFRSQIRENKLPELHFVHVRRGSNCVMYVTNGHFLYQEEGAEGVWMPVELPGLPQL